MERRENKIKYLENEERLSDSKHIEQMNQLRENKKSSKRKGYRNIDRINISPINNKYKKN